MPIGDSRKEALPIKLPAQSKFPGCRSWPTFAAATISAGVFLLTAAASSQTQQSEVSRPPIEPPPYWAYAVDPPASSADAAAKPGDNAPLHISGSKVSFTYSQIRDLFNAPDWHPSA